MRSSGTSNSQRASMHSRPLLRSVALSTVIFWPICQFGWRRASCAVTFASSSRGVSRKGPPEAVMTMRSTDFPVLAPEALPDGGVLGVDRAKLGARASGLGGDDVARHHEHFLVRERYRLAGANRGERGAEAGGADGGDDDEVHVRVGRHFLHLATISRPDRPCRAWPLDSPPPVRRKRSADETRGLALRGGSHFHRPRAR